MFFRKELKMDDDNNIRYLHEGPEDLLSFVGILFLHFPFFSYYFSEIRTVMALRLSYCLQLQFIIKGTVGVGQCISYCNHFVGSSAQS